MKTIIPPKHSNQGTALLVALFLCLILSVTIAGYLQHSRQQNFLSMRSQTWNMSIAVSEAGIEDALQHLNANATNLSANGWAQVGSTYVMNRTLDAKTSYTVEIDASNPFNPTITSQAFLKAPTLAANMPSVMLATIGATLTESSNNDVVSRAIRVKAGRDGFFLRAIVAKHTINMNGNNVMTDSFNSADPNFSNNGRYPAGDWSKLLDNGDVASNDSIVNVINVGNANIYGRVAVGPGGTVAILNGGVGTRIWQSFNTGIQPGYFTDDMNFTFPTVSLPYATGLTPSSGTVSTTNYTYSSSTNVVTSSTYPSPVPASGVQTNISYTTYGSAPSSVPYGTITNKLTVATSSSSYPAAGTYVGTVTKKGSKYYYSKITGTNYIVPSYSYTYTTGTITTNYTVTTKTYDYIVQGGAANLPPVDYYINGSIDKANILVKGNARLVVRNNVKQSGLDQIVIEPDGKLQMWVGGTSVDLSGKGVMNKNGYAQNFMLWCADSVTSVKYSGNGEFIGVVVTPNGNVTLNGGGSGPEDFIGALIANTVVLNGHFKFHYDEALKDLNNSGRYKITEWNEVNLTQLNN